MEKYENSNVVFCSGACILRGRNNNCDWYNVECKLDCKVYLETINSVKKLLDTEAKKDTMAVHPRERIVKAVINGDAIIAKENNGKIIGFVYLIHWEKHIEIAGLIIEESFRKHKLGGQLFKKILALATHKYPKKKIIFFANGVSQKFGKKYNFSPMPELLTSTEFQSLCKNCTKEYKKPQNCRCRVMVLDK